MTCSCSILFVLFSLGRGRRRGRGRGKGKGRGRGRGWGGGGEGFRSFFPLAERSHGCRVCFVGIEGNPKGNLPFQVSACESPFFVGWFACFNDKAQSKNWVPNSCHQKKQKKQRATHARKTGPFGLGAPAAAAKGGPSGCRELGSGQSHKRCAWWFAHPFCPGRASHLHCFF